MIRRRDLLRAVVSAPLVVAACRQEPTMTNSTMPVIFLAHGAPMLLDDAGWVAELAAWAKALPRPKAILMVSAHWDERPLQIGATTPVPLVYDFYGFPEKFYRLQYPSPGAPELAGKVEELMRASGRGYERSDRGLDHGAYVPLLAMYPQADVPVLQISLPGLDAKDLFAFGRELAPLRRDGVLVVGSGFLTHNMREGFHGDRPAPWAVEFDDWAGDALARRDADALIDFMNKAPSARRALPTWEHYAPVLVTAGAAADDASATPTFPINGWWAIAPSFTKRSVQFG
jgi:4,5-DOPA dioxygenase extradiol